MNMQPELVGDGVLIAGDAAGMCMNLGFTIRGMDLAISAGEAAAENGAFRNEARRLQQTVAGRIPSASR